jgi:hypothetical protein
MGVSGWLMYLAQLAGYTLLCIFVAAYGLGATDGWTEHKVWRAKLSGLALLTVAVFSLLAHRVFRIDDRQIGRAEAELQQCLDQTEALVNFPLHLPGHSKSFVAPRGGDLAPDVMDATAGTVVRNSRGALGTIRAGLRYTEI